MADLKKVRVQLLNTETGAVVDEVDVLTSPEAVVFSDGKTLTEKIAEGFDGGNASTVNGHTVESNVPANAKFTDTVYTHPATHPATMIEEDTTHRFVTDAEKTKWNTAPTKTTVGLGNVTNDAQVKRSEMGAASGVATLDTTGKVPSSQLPSYVDDVLEYDTKSVFPTTGESGKIYIDIATNKTYRWSGTTYAPISESLALGETSSTAYAGNKGKANADAIAKILDGTTTVPKAEDSSTVSGFTVGVNVPANAKFTDTTYSAATTSKDGLMSKTDKAKLDGLKSVSYGTDSSTGTDVKLFFKVI